MPILREAAIIILDAASKAWKRKKNTDGKLFQVVPDDGNSNRGFHGQIIRKQYFLIHIK